MASSANSPRAASAKRATTPSANCVESGNRPPFHLGTTPRLPVARRTTATMSFTFRSCNSRPAKTNRSPGRSRAMKYSSIVPSVLPEA